MSDEQRAVLLGLAEFADPDAVRRYDALAERFYRATGIIAPGKSVPFEMCNVQPPGDAVAAAYREWLRKYLLTLWRDAQRILEEHAKAGR